MPTTSAQLPLMKRNLATAPDVPEPFSIQLESHRTALLQQAYLIIGNHADAEDAVQETLISAMQRVQGINSCQEIVVGQNEELIAMLAIPADNIFRRRIAIAVEGMSVSIAFVPGG